MRSLFTTIAVCLACLAAWAPAAARAQETLTLENGCLGLTFDRKTGTLSAVHNKLAGETYPVQGDAFEVEAVEFRVGSAGARLASLERQGDALLARYEADILPSPASGRGAGGEGESPWQRSIWCNRGEDLATYR